jgi:pimeloyl-ACP methyl ester carboxylesterase
LASSRTRGLRFTRAMCAIERSMVAMMTNASVEPASLTTKKPRPPVRQAGHGRSGLGGRGFRRWPVLPDPGGAATPRLRAGAQLRCGSRRPPSWQRVGERSCTTAADRSAGERPRPYATDVHKQADDAAALIEAIAAAPPIVVGRSHGGAIAFDFAFRYPDRVRALVLLEGDVPSVSETAAKERAELQERLLATVTPSIPPTPSCSTSLTKRSPSRRSHPSLDFAPGRRPARRPGL